MLSVIIPTCDSAAALQGLLAVLVPAAVDGLVREVICADAGSTDPTAEICEDAGAQLLTGGLVAAARVAKGEWVLVLPPEIQLQRDWVEALKAHLTRGKRPAVLRGVREPGFAARFRSVPTGLLAETVKLTGRAETRDVAVMVRALAAGAVRL
jgi:glycosyltransferase involved in cell wall biosynthesis